jgi:hypothetical protein
LFERVAVSITFLLFICSASAADPGPFATQVEFAISGKDALSSESIISAHRIPQPGSTEMAALVTAACAVFEIDCSKEATVGRQAIKAMTAEDDVRGEEHHGIFRAPEGYEICKAKVDLNKLSMTENVTFNTQIVRRPDNNGLGYFAYVPKHTFTSSSEWIEATIYLEFVPSGQTAQFGCWPTQTNPWLCKGGNCSKILPGAKV